MTIGEVVFYKIYSKCDNLDYKALLSGGDCRKSGCRRYGCDAAELGFMGSGDIAMPGNLPLKIHRFAQDDRDVVVEWGGA